MRLKIVREKQQKPASPEPAQTSSMPGRKRLHFDAHMTFGEQDAKKIEIVKDKEGSVIDYRNVTIRGYLSTFAHVTPSDRQGDYVEKGAFTETLPKFMANPVLLVNHDNSVKSLVGKFTTVVEDSKGLYVEALLSNSPGNIDVRFKVAEGVLKTLSMGGVFHYLDNGRAIFKVDLWEGSLTPLPANPDASFTVRELTEHERKKVAADALPLQRSSG